MVADAINGDFIVIGDLHVADETGGANNRCAETGFVAVKTPMICLAADSQSS